jgi:hypothetical protein
MPLRSIRRGSGCGSGSDWDLSSPVLLQRQLRRQVEDGRPPLNTVESPSQLSIVNNILNNNNPSPLSMVNSILHSPLVPSSRSIMRTVTTSSIAAPSSPPRGRAVMTTGEPQLASTPSATGSVT